MRPHIEQITESLLDKCDQLGGMEVIADLASALPVQVLSDLMGVPASDRPLLRRWADQLLGFQGVNKPPLELLLEAQTAIVEIRQYLGIALEERRKNRAMTCSVLLPSWSNNPTGLLNQRSSTRAKLCWWRVTKRRDRS